MELDRAGVSLGGMDMVNVSDVLVVSGSEVLRGLVKFGLGRWWGVVIRNADSSEVALAALAERVPQLAIIDADMPGAEEVGRVLAASTRVIAVNAATPATWSSASVEPPFQPPKLHAAIEAVLD
jgi:DNA-binding response OmpR family regulator